MESYIDGKTIKGRDMNGNEIEGHVIMTFVDAIASGTNEYVPVTYLLVADHNNGNKTFVMRPRDVSWVNEDPAEEWFNKKDQKEEVKA